MVKLSSFAADKADLSLPLRSFNCLNERKEFPNIDRPGKLILMNIFLNRLFSYQMPFPGLETGERVEAI
jgi:hypothetical protein